MQDNKIEVPDYTLRMKVDWRLKPEQNEIVDFLVNNPRSFNCAQTGLGKTITTITAAVHVAARNPDKNYQFVLLLPNAAVKSFTDTLGKILGVPFNIYTATTMTSMPNARFHIFNYSTIGKGIFDKKRKKDDKPLTLDTLRHINNPYLNKFIDIAISTPNLYLIADEAHVLQDDNTVQFRTVETLLPLFSGVWFLTATPILNDLEGYYRMVDLLIPNFFGNIFRFRNKYMVIEYSDVYKYNPKTKQRKLIKTMDVVGYKNLDKLALEFEKISIIRANKYNIVFNYRSATLSTEMLSFYKLAVQGLFSGKVVNPKEAKKDKTKAKTKKSEQEHAGARLHDMQRVVSNSHKDFQLLKRDELTEKEYLLIQTILEVINREESVLIYFSYLESLERVKYILNKIKTKFNIPTIHEISGDISLNERKVVEQNIKPRDVVVITSAGTESVNLQRANNLIFYEIPFALRQFIQACGRIARTDSKFDLFNIYILEAVGTIDTYKKNRIMMNAAPIQSVLGGSNILPTDVLSLSLADKQAMKDELLWLK